MDFCKIKDNTTANLLQSLLQFFHSFMCMLLQFLSKSPSFFFFSPLNCHFQFSMSYLDPSEAHKIHTPHLNLGRVNLADILKANLKYSTQVRLSSQAPSFKNSMEGRRSQGKQATRNITASLYLQKLPQEGNQVSAFNVRNNLKKINKANTTRNNAGSIKNVRSVSFSSNQEIQYCPVLQEICACILSS